MRQETMMQRESRLRRLATRHGYAVRKSRSRNPEALTFQTFGVIDPSMNAWVATFGGNGYGLDLDEVEDWLADLVEA